MDILYKKPLTLPSSHTLGYNSTVWLSSLRYNFHLYQEEAVYDSLFEFFLTIIKHQAELPAGLKLEQMYLQDFYFLVSYIIMTDLFKEDNYYNTEFCSKCGNKNKVLISFGNLDFKIINPYISKIQTLKEVYLNGFEITLRHRTVQDNIDLSALMLYYQSDVYIFNRILYVMSQIVEIKKTDSDTIINQEDYFNLLRNLRTCDIKYLYETVLKMLSEFGFNNHLQYNCKACNALNDMKLYDNIILSYVQPSQFNVLKFEDTWKGFLELARLPIFQFSDVALLPLKHGNSLEKIITAMKFKRGEVMV